jgi:LysR family transcriptional regulator, regulator for bpeEF and oprC
MDKHLAMKAFAATVEHGSFTAAGKQLGVSVSNVTKLVACLEAEFGTSLLVRSTRRVTPTDAGEEFYIRTARILKDIADSEARLRDKIGAPRGTLRVLLPHFFGRMTVLPELGRLLATYPDLNLEIDFSDEIPPTTKHTFDIAVIKGDLRDTSLVTRVLTRGKLLTVATPDLLARVGIPQTPDDLRKHDCIIGRHGPAWRFRVAGREHLVEVHGRVVVRSGDALLDAAVHGLGIAQGTWWLFRRSLQNRQLVTILDDYVDDGDEMRAILHEGRYMSRNTRAFLDFLVEITRAKPSRRDRKRDLRSGGQKPDRSDRSADRPRPDRSAPGPASSQIRAELAG